MTGSEVLTGVIVDQLTFGQKLDNLISSALNDPNLAFGLIAAIAIFICVVIMIRTDRAAGLFISLLLVMTGFGSESVFESLPCGYLTPEASNYQLNNDVPQMYISSIVKYLPSSDINRVKTDVEFDKNTYMNQNGTVGTVNGECGFISFNDRVVHFAAENCHCNEEASGIFVLNKDSLYHKWVEQQKTEFIESDYKIDFPESNVRVVLDSDEGTLKVMSVEG